MMDDEIKHGMEVMDELAHFGVLGMKWGVRNDETRARYNRKGNNKPDRLRKASKDNVSTSRPGAVNRAAKKVSTKAVQTAYAVGAKANPREFKYSAKRALTRSKAHDKSMVEMSNAQVRKTGILSSDPSVVQAIEREGIAAHKRAQYSNLDKSDIAQFKKYTDAAIYSRAVNGYLATGTPKEIAQKAADLKKALSKNTVNNQVVYRSTAMQFSTEGLAKKLEQHGEAALKSTFNDFDKNFKGKSFKENRVYSTSTSPAFAIDTWRKVNPTAAKNYNTYLVINTKNTPGILADGRTSDNKKLVNTRSNQEAILAPGKMTYRKIAWDPEREMFAVYLDAEA